MLRVPGILYWPKILRCVFSIDIHFPVKLNMRCSNEEDGGCNALPNNSSVSTTRSVLRPSSLMTTKPNPTESGSIICCGIRHNFFFLFPNFIPGESAQLNDHLFPHRGQYFVHVPVGQALALIQPDTPAAKSFVWLKCSHQLEGAACRTPPHGPRGPGHCQWGNLAEQGSVETQLRPLLMCDTSPWLSSHILCPKGHGR